MPSFGTGGDVSAAIPRRHAATARAVRRQLSAAQGVKKTDYLRIYVFVLRWWERGSDDWARGLAWQRVRASRARGRLVVILVEVGLRRLGVVVSK